VRLKSVLPLMPDAIRIALGKTTVDVAIKHIDFNRVPTEKEDYVFEAQYNKRKTAFHIYFPALREDGTYLHRGNLYVGVPNLEVPPVVVQNRPRSRVLTILNPGGVDTIMTLFDERATIKKGRPLGDISKAINRAPHLFTTPLLPRDRELFNLITGSEEKEQYVTKNDIECAATILTDFEDYENDPKDIGYMRLMGIEEVVLRIIINSLQVSLRPFIRGSKMDAVRSNRDLERFLSTSPQCQLYNGDNPMALLGLKEKVKVPMPKWAPLEVAKPHSTWEKAICVIDTPQSSRAGEILALTDGAVVQDGQVKPGESLFSGLLKKVTLFPHLLDPHRVVMMSSIAEQSCNLGEHNEPLRITPKDTEHLPQPFGTYGNIALMDYAYTHEDGCVISEELANKLSTEEIHQDRYVIPSSVHESPEFLVEPSDTITPFRKVMMDVEGKPVSTSCRTSGIVTETKEYTDIIGGGECKVFEITSRIVYKCEIGSKLCGTHANKMTVSRILPGWLMPKMEDGGHVDIIYSPASIAKRKMPSLVMEIMINKILEATGETRYISDGTESFPQIAKLLADAGLPDDATEQLSILMNPFPHRTLVGPTFIMLLHHHPRSKLRIGGRVTHDYRGVQQRGVGQSRYNREELEALFQHGAHNIMAELYDTVGKSELYTIMKERLRTLGVWSDQKQLETHDG